MLNIGIIGCGEWSKKIIKEVEYNKNFNLKSIVCRNYKSKILKVKKNVLIFKDIENFFKKNINDCVYVAGTPELNIKVTKLANKYKMPLILEKPITNSYKEAQELQKIAKNSKMIILPNLSYYFSDSFFYLKIFIKKNINEIKQIIIYEGGNGPFRKNIHPIWDWGFHSFSTLINLFEYKNISNINSQEIKKTNLFEKGIVTKFKANIDSRFEVKLLTGNIFKKKIRKIKVILNNGSNLESNLNNHKIYLNGNIVFKSSTSPLQSLLDKFNFNIVEDNIDLSQSLLKTSCETTKILEKFYKY